MTSFRKDHSIAILVAEVIASVPENPSEPVPIDVAALKEKLGGRSKRLYEVLSVMEAVLLVSKPSMNTYLWNGLGHLSKTVAYLSKISDQLDVSGCIKRFKDSKNRSVTEDRLVEASIATPTYSAAANAASTAAGTSDVFLSKDKMSLTVLAQKVLMIFMSEAPNFVSVKMCGEILSVPSRRVYDAANVLAALPVPLLKTSRFFSKEGNVRKYNYSGPAINVSDLTHDDILSLPVGKKDKSLFSLELLKGASPPKSGVRLTLPDGQVLFLPGKLEASAIKLKEDPEPNPEL